jgi:MATE family multidrug resistance protein
MGHLESDSYIGAIAIGALIFNFIYWGFGYLRMGTSGFTAQARGKRDLTETINVFSRALLIAIVGGLGLIILQKPIELLSFSILKGEAEVEAMATSYFRIRIWAAPAALLQFAFMGWFIGMQNAKIPMLVAIVTNMVNIAFNYLFVIVWDYGSDGVAYGTVIAQYSGLIVAVFFFWRYFRKLLRLWSSKAAFQLAKLKEFMLVNTDIFIRTMCLVLVFSFFTATSATADVVGDGKQTILAVNSLLMQFFMFFSFLIDGFAHASEALVGRFIGSGNRDSLIKVSRLLFKWGFVISLFFTLFYLFASDTIIRLLTDIPEVTENSKPYIFWVVIVPVVSFAAFLWDGIYIGATAGKAMRNSMIIATVFVFFPAYWFLSKLFGNHGLWMSFILFLVARGVAMTFMARKAVFNKIPA